MFYPVPLLQEGKRREKSLYDTVKETFGAVL